MAGAVSRWAGLNRNVASVSAEGTTHERADENDACLFLFPEESCAIPFTYAGKKYFDCTGRDSMRDWCSLDKEYLGRWKYCTKDGE